MTENEAIENLQDMYDVASCRIKNGDARGVIYIPPDKMDSFIVAITALKELQHYQMIKGVTIGEIAETLGEYAKIGTVEECWEAVEKQKAKKPKEILRHRGGFETHHCPNCNTDYQTDNRYTILDSYCPSCGKLLDSVFGNYCGNCGRAICWEGSEEE